MVSASPPQSLILAVCCITNADNVELYVGDIFSLTCERLRDVDAALIALPASTRNRYASHLMDITQCAHQLLIYFEYDQNITKGLPFSVDRIEVKGHYGTTCRLKLAESEPVVGGLKGQSKIDESIRILRLR